MREFTLEYIKYLPPPTKLRKGNVCVCVCVCVCMYVSVDRGPMTITHDTLNLTTQGPQPWSCTDGHKTSLDPLRSDIWRPSLWRPVQMCQGWAFVRDTPPVLTSGGYWGTYSLCKRAVRILLECCLVNLNFSGCNILFQCFKKSVKITISLHVWPNYDLNIKI